MCRHNHWIAYPAITTQLDYEGELAVVVGRTAEHIHRDDAWGYVAGYTIINDISARDLQESDREWIGGKSLDDFAPMVLVFVTADELGDVDLLRIQTHVDGELRQNAYIGEMHFTIPCLLEFITQGITLRPGDIIATSTPAGVGLGFRPPKWLFPGDVVEVSIGGVGTLRTEIDQSLCN